MSQTGDAANGTISGKMEGRLWISFSSFHPSMVRNDTVVDPALWLPLQFHSYFTTVMGSYGIITAEPQTVPGIPKMVLMGLLGM